MHADMVGLHAQGLRPAYFRLNQAIHAKLAGRILGNPVTSGQTSSVIGAIMPPSSIRSRAIPAEPSGQDGNRPRPCRRRSVRP